MTYPHPMRLRGPWNWATLPPAEPRTGTVHVPTDWGEILGPEFAGPVRFSRHFQAPSRLEPHERLFLVAQGLDAVGTVRVNETELGQVTTGYPGLFSYDITAQLQSRNLLEIDVTVPPDAARYGREGKAGGLVREVRLEVRAEAYLETVGIWAEAEPSAIAGQLCVHAADTNIRALELHVRAGQTNQRLAVEVNWPGKFTLPVDNLQRWEHARGAATPVELVLMQGDRRLWERTFYTGLPGNGHWPPQHVRPLPAIDWCTWLRTWPRPSLAPPESETETFLVREILPDEAYATFDESGVAILQAIEVPASASGDHDRWLEAFRQVALPLAHHPCIVGWVRPSHTGSEAWPPLYGRPWWNPSD